MNSQVELSIIIVSFNVRDYLLACVASIKKNTAGIAYEIIIVDNNSSDNSADAVIEAYPDVKLIRNTGNPGFARANNQAFEMSRGEFLLLLNPDTEVKPGAIERVLEFIKNEKTAAIAGCRNVGSDGSLQKSITRFPGVIRNLAQAFFIDRLFFPERKQATYYRPAPFKADSVGGAFMMVRRVALNGEQLLNTDYFMYSEEKDLALRLKRAGWETWFLPTVEIIHHGGKSTSSMPEKMFLEVQKSQAMFYLNFHSNIHALALCASWWLVLITHSFASLFLCFTNSGRKKFVLFSRTVPAFPVYTLQTIIKK
ncbi:MAG: glycosyltransferase family 2 protein [Fibrobacter sp.]|nr:glycosyltransferase family 2 protein [Fibrobacter sp.]